MKKGFILLCFFICLFFSCETNNITNTSSLFLLKTSTGVTFNNSLEHTEMLNPYTYRNFYNGGGVAIGDIDNDGLPDVFFSGNQVKNQLYRNKGDLKFENISTSAGIESSLPVWCCLYGMSGGGGGGC